MIGFKQELKYPIQNKILPNNGGYGQFSAHNVVVRYHEKKGKKHIIKAPITTPNVLAALCSRFNLVRSETFPDFVETGSKESKFPFSMYLYE